MGAFHSCPDWVTCRPLPTSFGAFHALLVVLFHHTDHRYMPFLGRLGERKRMLTTWKHRYLRSAPAAVPARRYGKRHMAAECDAASPKSARASFNRRHADVRTNLRRWR